MKNKYTLNPLLCAALGAAVGYYGFAPVFTALRASALTVLIPVMLVLAAFVLALFLLYKSNSYRLARRRIFALFFAAGFAVGIGTLGASFRESRLSPGIPPREVTGIGGILLDDPRTTMTGRGAALLKLEKCAGLGNVQASANGTVRVFFPEGTIPRLKEFGRGSHIFVDGNFIESANAQRSAMFRAKSVHIVKAAGAVNQMRTKIRLALVNMCAPYRWGGLALALLLGIRDNLDSHLALSYQNAGCAYILALSGMHLAIISSIIAFLLRKPCGLKAAAAIGALFIVIYIYLVGAQPSLLRAGIAYVIGTVAILTLLPVNGIQLLAFSFLLQLLIEPASGMTVSFILSYTALAGILSIGQDVNRLIKTVIPEFISGSLSLSIGAFVTTMGVTAFYFGDVRLAGIISSLVVVPLTTIFMIGGIIFLAIYSFAPLRFALDTALSLIYMMMEEFTAFMGRIPGIIIVNKIPFVLLSIVFSLGMIYFCARQLRIQTGIEKFD